MIFAISKTGIEAQLSLDVQDGNEYGTIGIDGDELLIRELLNRLDGAYGAFGHPINIKSATAIDLDYALRQMQDLTVEVTEGAEMVEVYDPDIPAGAVT
jgi:hypothetical protein